MTTQRTQIVDKNNKVTHVHKRIDPKNIRGREITLGAPPTFQISDENGIGAKFKDRIQRAFDVSQWMLDNKNAADPQFSYDKGETLQTALTVWEDMEKATGYASAAKDHVIGSIEYILEQDARTDIEPEDKEFNITPGERAGYELALRFAKDEPVGYSLESGVVDTPDHNLYAPEDRFEGLIKLVNRKTNLNDLDISNLQRIADDVNNRLNVAKLVQLKTKLSAKLPDVAKFEALKETANGGFVVNSITTTDGARFDSFAILPAEISESMRVIKNAMNDYNPNDERDKMFEMVLH